MRILSAVFAAIGFLALAGNPAHSDELKIFGSRVTKMVVDAVGPEF